ncbi:bifunctional diguanylate cyclase/phosphodiesterase [Actinoplanes sp. NPDC051851]|uniref:putative bifunctional diguanylate cyclase/phosphodiesterase n=1 Tax=Actinoplanes sp. NPDC051851 TaxID=3154753 RepID=UPI00342FDCC9
MARTPRPAREQDGTRLRRTRRWMVGLLVATLALLSGYALLDSRRHGQIVDDIVRAGQQVSAYQQAAYLSAWEMTLIEATANNPAGTERRQVLAVDEQAYQATVRIAAIDGEKADAIEVGLIAQRQMNLRQAIVWYLSLLDRGEHAKAVATLETDIEPAYRRNMARLLELRDEHQEYYTAQQAAAQHDSRRLFWGSVISFVLSLIVLTLFALNVRAHRRQVERMAATDTLTGLPNRAAFTAHTQLALTATPSARSSPGITVLTVNINGFRHVNDQLGPHMGDRLLAEAGWRLAGVVRDTDLVARIGGDEFAILLRDIDTERAERVADRLCEAFDQPFQLDDITVDLEISIGAATAAPDDDVSTLLGHADSAMHDAKQQHEGFRRFSPHTGVDTTTRLSLLGDLRRGLGDADQFTLHYQPKVRLADESIAGVEALARWHHPTKGPISPGMFVPVLETTSLIHPFTERVLTIALQQARDWLDAGHRVPVAVNVSTRSLLDESFPTRLATLLESAGVPGDLLCIEITEHTVMSDPSTTIDALHRVRDLGVKTSIDDFGTGYSSLTYLKLLPVDELKIDRSFVADMVTDPSSHALVASAVDLAHNLGLRVVAEGVEDAETAEALAKLNCDTAQGYHFARPLPAPELTEKHLNRRPLPA